MHPESGKLAITLTGAPQTSRQPLRLLSQQGASHVSLRVQVPKWKVSISKTRVTIPNIETLNTLYLATWDP